MSNIVTIYPDRTSPQTSSAADSRPVELGVRFQATQPGAVLGIRYLKGRGNDGTHVGTLWSASGAKLTSAVFTDSKTSNGWQSVRFSTPIQINAYTDYIASYYAPSGHYAQQQGLFDHQQSFGISPVLRATSGLFSYGASAFPTTTWRNSAYYVDVLFDPNGHGSTPPTSTSPKPSSSTARSSASASHTPVKKTSTPPPTSSAPPRSSSAPPPSSSSAAPSSSAPAGLSSPPAAGVPAGTALTTYTGPSTITQDGTVIDSKIINTSLEIAAKNVVITRSRINGNGDDGIHVSGSLTISNSTVSGGSNGIGGDNYTATRVEVTNLSDDGFKLGNNVHVDQSWCHDLTPTSQAHADCGQMQAGVTNMSVTNSWFDGGRNSALFLAPDLGPSSNGPVLINNNVLGNGNYTLYCVDGNNGQYFVKNITITNNRFLNTSQYGPMTINVPVTASNNTWFSTGKPVN